MSPLDVELVKKTDLMGISYIRLKVNCKCIAEYDQITRFKRETFNYLSYAFKVSILIHTEKCTSWLSVTLSLEMYSCIKPVNESILSKYSVVCGP